MGALADKGISAAAVLNVVENIALLWKERAEGERGEREERRGERREGGKRERRERGETIYVEMIAASASAYPAIHHSLTVLLHTQPHARAHTTTTIHTSLPECVRTAAAAAGSTSRAGMKSCKSKFHAQTEARGGGGRSSAPESSISQISFSFSETARRNLSARARG